MSGWAAAGQAVAELASTGLEYEGKRQATNKASDAARYALDFQQQQAAQTRRDLSPWLQTGELALADIGKLSGVAGGDPMTAPLTKPFGMADFQASPAYNFNLEEGQKAINKAAAARGQYYNPATLQDIAKFSQGLASNEFQNAFSNYNTNQRNLWDRLYALSGSGQNAATNLGAFGTTVGGQVGNTYLEGGKAAAAGTVGQYNALASGADRLANSELMRKILATSDASNYNSTGATSANVDSLPW